MFQNVSIELFTTRKAHLQILVSISSISYYFSRNSPSHPLNALISDLFTSQSVAHFSSFDLRTWQFFSCIFSYFFHYIWMLKETWPLMAAPDKPVLRAKYQRRRCSVCCPLAPYFAPDQPRCLKTLTSCLVYAIFWRS